MPYLGDNMGRTLMKSTPTLKKRPAAKAAKPAKTPKPLKAAASPARQIDSQIKALGDWRGDVLARIRSLIKAADPEVIEELKWRGVPVWSHAGIICTGETYKKAVKTTFAKGAALKDPKGLFNASRDGNTRRAIDFTEGGKIDETAFKALIREAVALNTAKAAKSRKKPRR